MADTIGRTGPSAINGSAQTFLTVTSLHSFGVKSIRIVNNTASPVTVKVGIGGVADANLIIPVITISPGAFYQDDSFFTLLTTETLQYTTSGAGLEMTVSYLDHTN
jgi:hypothetical protein